MYFLKRHRVTKCWDRSAYVTCALLSQNFSYRMLKLNLHALEPILVLFILDRILVVRQMHLSSVMAKLHYAN
jgi:hypothetical protein